MGTASIHRLSDVESTHPARKRIGIEVSEDLHMWLRTQADLREQSLSAFVRGALAGMKRRQETAA